MTNQQQFIQPREIWRHRGKVLGPLVADTETSGLYVDDGARCSVVSTAWRIHQWDAQLWSDLGAHVGQEEIGDRLEPVWIASCAWPFDQGTDGKEGLRTGSAGKRGLPGPGKGVPTQGQEVMWADAPNQPWWVWRGLLKVMALWPSGLVWHNAKFDQHIMRAGVRRERWGWIEVGKGQRYPGVEDGYRGWAGDGIDLSGQVKWDTQLVAKRLWPMAIDPKTGMPTSSLKPTAARLWGVAETDEAAKVRQYLQQAKLPAGRWDLVPWDIIGPYADQDARLTLRLVLRQQAEIEAARASAGVAQEMDLTRRVGRDLATMNMLYRQEVRGVPYPRDESDQWAQVLEGRQQQAEQRLPFSPATLPAAKRHYFGPKDEGGLGLQPYAETDKGEPQMTAQVVLQMQRDRVEGIDTWADVQKLKTAASMWYRGYAQACGADGRLRTCYRQVARGKEGDGGTRSTRFSVERVNLQAIPQNYRLDGFACLDGVPTPRDLIASAVPDGWAIWELDLAQAELRVGALMARCGRMLSMMKDGQDLHTYTTKQLFPKLRESDTDWDMMRQVGKKGNFSLGFGSGADTFGEMVAKETGIYLGDREARRIVRTWNGLYPEWGRAIETHSRRVALRQDKLGYGWVVLVNGERRWFTQYEDTHKAFNQRVQGSLAQFGIEWALLTEQFLSGRELVTPDGGGGGLVLLIHDSQVLLLPQGVWAEDEASAREGGWTGQQMADECAKYATTLWGNWFRGVPGGSEAKQWKQHKAKVGA